MSLALILLLAERTQLNSRFPPHSEIGNTQPHRILGKKMYFYSQKFDVKWITTQSPKGGKESEVLKDIFT